MLGCAVLFWKVESFPALHKRQQKFMSWGSYRYVESTSSLSDGDITSNHTDIDPDDFSLSNWCRLGLNSSLEQCTIVLNEVFHRPRGLIFEVVVTTDR